jgi:DNA mismatch endonuclease (patch repair protein)
MPDVFTKAKRSEVMSRIRGRGNRGTELALAALLRRHNLTGWRRHLPLPGRPDFAFSRARLAVFVDGCFWHCCPRCGNFPANNRAFWRAKLMANVTRDRRVTRELRRAGWTVLRIWEHALADGSARARVVGRLRHALSTARP